MESKRESILKQKEEAELKVQQYENKIKLLQNRKQHLEKKADRQRTSVFSFEQEGYNIDVLRQQSGFIGLTQRQKEQCEECYRALTPYRNISVLATGEDTKQIGAYNFVNDSDKISEAVIIILYMLRCCLAHGIAPMPNQPNDLPDLP